MKRTLLILLCLFMMVMPAAAQDAACNIDLAPIAASVVQAQAAASSGDTTQALALMAQIRAKLEATEALCGAAGGDDPTVPPVAALTQRYVVDSDVGSVSFNFPEGWSATRDSGGVMVATAPDILQREFNNDPPPMFTGEALIFVTAGDADSFGGREGDDLLTLMRNLADDVPSGFGRISEPVSVTVGDQPAAVFTVSGANTEIMFLTVEIGASGGETAYGQFILLTAPGELNASEPTLQAVAETIEFAP